MNQVYSDATKNTKAAKRVTKEIFSHYALCPLCLISGAL